MKKSQDKTSLLIFLCWAAYTAAYVGRLNYNASMVEILAQLGTDKESAGIVSSFFFFAYGAGQLINGLLSKKYNTKYSVTIALAASSIINLAMSLCGDISVMKYLWFLNGAFQSVLWSSLIKTLSIYLTDEKLSKAAVVMSTTVAAGTFASYGMASLFSALNMQWTSVFYVATAVLGVIAVIWFFGMTSVEKQPKNIIKQTAETKQKTGLKGFVSVSVVFLLFAAISNGFIKDGVTTWVPSILTEEFNVPASLSIMITLLLPLLSFLGAATVKTMHKKIPNTDTLNGIYYLISTLLTIAIIFAVNGGRTVISLILFGGTSCMMSAINNVITSIIPLYSRDKIDSGTLAGVLNTFCYIGSTLSITLLGKIADTSGWNEVFICILIFSAAACILSFIGAIATGKKKTKQ